MALVAAISPFVLAVLKYAFIALVYFFVYRAIRAVAGELSDRKARRTTARAEVRAARSIGKAPQVVVVKDDAGRKLQTQRLNGPIQIGRADACHIKLDDTYVSNFHARLFPKDGTWHIEDLGSTNGTYLNGEPLRGPQPLHVGDSIRIGDSEFTFER